MAECQDEQAVGRLRARAATQSRLPRGPWRQPIKPNGRGTSPAGAGLRWRELSSLPGAGAETRWRGEQATGSLGNATRRQDGGFARVAPPAGTGAAGGRVINLVTAAWPTLSPGFFPSPPHTSALRRWRKALLLLQLAGLLSGKRGCTFLHGEPPVPVLWARLVLAAGGAGRVTAAWSLGSQVSLRPEFGVKLCKRSGFG